MKIKILSDSTCDLPQALLEQNDITLVPLTVVKGDQQFKDGLTITPGDIFAHVAAGGELCSTAAVSIGEYEDLFETYCQNYEGILLINIGSGFSACYQNACLAAQEFENIRCVDSRNLTAGQGLVVLEACRLARELDSLDAIVQALEAYARRVECSFLVEKLDYLVKGGRCSSAAALGANLLSLKPCIEVRDGKLTVVKKYRGSYSKCLTSYIRDRLADREDLLRDTMFLVRTEMDPELLASLRETADTVGGFSQLYMATAGSTISCHCGPGTVGLAYVRT